MATNLKLVPTKEHYRYILYIVRDIDLVGWVTTEDLVNLRVSKDIRNAKRMSAEKAACMQKILNEKLGIGCWVLTENNVEVEEFKEVK